MPDTDFKLPSMSAEEALTHLATGSMLLLDLRKPDAVRTSGRLLAAAARRDPFSFDHNDPLMTHDGPIAVFCVHGHEVSNFGCALLRVHGREAVFVRGGFEALIAAGATTTALEDTE